MAKKLAKFKPAGNTVDLGESAKDGVELCTMFPQTLKVKPNTTVTFTMSKAHARDAHGDFRPGERAQDAVRRLPGRNFPSQGVYPSAPTRSS